MGTFTKGGKSWTKIGNGLVNSDQGAELNKLLAEKPSNSLTATLRETGDDLIIAIKGEEKVVKVTSDGKASKVNPPKDEPQAEKPAAGSDGPEKLKEMLNPS